MFVLRPVIMIPAWSFYALGVHMPPVAGESELFSAIAQPGFWCLTAILACAYVANQVFDQASDRLNGKGLFLTHGVFRTRTMIAIALVCFLAASWLFQRVTGAQRFPLIGAMWLALIYSLPPLRLCSRPWLDLIANAVGYGGLAFAAGASGVSEYALAAFLDSYPWMLLVAATFLHTTILDVDGDAAARKRTTSVAIGVAWSAHIATAFGALAFAACAWRYFERAGSLLGMLVTAMVLLVLVVAHVTILRADKMDETLRTASRARASSRAVQAITVVVALWACLRDPVLLGLFAPLVVAARYYYRARFYIRYPG